MIKFSRVSKVYPGSQPALQNISFFINKGEMVFLTGHSGAGKSTVLRLLSGFEKPNDGEIFIKNVQVQRLKKDELPFLRRSIGMIYQDYQLLMDHSVFDNVAMPLIILGKSKDEIKRRVNTVLRRVGLLEKTKHYPIQLSGGEQQRIGIARAIVNKPLILLADEPTGNLDDALSKEIFIMFEELNRAGTTILITTHNLKLIKKHYRVLRLDHGRLVGDKNGKK